MSLLDNIRVFVRVVELGSLSAAGRNMRLSPAVVSHRIQSLEGHLGVRLLNRTTREVQATAQGVVFYEHCLDVLRAVERAESSIVEESGDPRGTLRLTAPLGLGRRLLGPLAAEYHAAHPQLTIQLRLSDHLLDLLKEGVDMAVRLARLEDSSLIVRKIAECPRVLCAAPAYLAARGEPMEPEDLLGHDCLLLRFPGSRQFQWTLAPPGAEPVRLAISGPVDADDGDLLTDWALAGHGIALKPRFEVAAHLKSGALRVVLPDCPPEPVTLAVLYPHREFLPAKVKAFADLLVERARAYIARAEAGPDG
jgi:DNA-binding transcriptional LysR family regulator